MSEQARLSHGDSPVAAERFPPARRASKAPLLPPRVGESGLYASRLRPRGHRTPSYQTPVRDGLNWPFVFHLSTTRPHPLKKNRPFSIAAISARAIRSGFTIRQPGCQGTPIRRGLKIISTWEAGLIRHWLHTVKVSFVATNSHLYAIWPRNRSPSFARCPRSAG